MLSKLAKFLLVATSFSPVLFTVAFLSWIDGTFWVEGIFYLAVALTSVALAVLVMAAARQQLEVLPVKIVSLKTVDREVLSFMIAYLFPMLSRSAPADWDWRVGLFVTIMFMGVIWGTHSYHFNPILGLLGYHFYEVTTEGSVTYVLLTRKSLRQTKSVNSVVQIGEYMLLDAS